MIQVAIGTLKLTGFFVVTLPSMALQFLLLTFDHPARHWFPVYYHRTLCHLLGISVIRVGAIDHSGGLVVSNHVSWLDIVVLSSILPVSFVAKKEVASWPLFGALAKLQDCVFVNRESQYSTGVSVNLLQKRLHSGESLVLFPEGTSGPGQKVLPFKSSYFGAIEGGQTMVIPVTLIYLKQHGLPITLRQRPSIAWYGNMEMFGHLWGVLKSGPIAVEAVFLPALRPNNYTNRKALARHVHALLSKCLAARLHAAGKMG